MMHFAYTILIALANNLDNIGVRIAYSLRGIRITPLKNLWISIITFIISLIAACTGSKISHILGNKFASIFSMLILVVVGLSIMLEPTFTKKKNAKKDKTSLSHVLNNPEDADMDNSLNIDFKEATILGIALSINNIGGGISAGMIGLNYIFVGFFSAIISYISLWLGNYLTAFLSRWNLKDKAAIISGIMLILIGIKQIL